MKADVSELDVDVDVFSGRSPSLEEGHVEDGRVRVHELEQEGLQDETLLEGGFRFRNL